MHSVMHASQRAVALACQWMRQTAPEAPIHNVQDVPRFQCLGVDFLWDKPHNVEGVEIKGDRSRGKHFFFELVSNFEKNTPGCFLYSRAHWLLYVFLPSQQLFPLHLPSARDWLVPIAQNFPLKKAYTHAGPIRYTTLGVTVPVSALLAALPLTQIWKLEGQAFSLVSPKAAHFSSTPP